METEKKRFYLTCLLLGVLSAHFINLIAVRTLNLIGLPFSRHFLWVEFYTMGMAFFMSLNLTLFFVYVFEPPDTNRPPLPGDDELPTVSVVVPAYNEERGIGRAIECILENDYPKDKLEVIVVDDGSTDKTAEIASRYPVRLIRNKKNLRRGGAIYEGIKNAKGDIVITIDADTYPQKGALRYLSSEFQDDNVGAVCGFLIPTESRGFLGRQQTVEYLLGFAYNKHLRANTGWMLIPSGAFSAYRRELLEDSNPIDTLAEDFDMGLHVHKKGYELKYAPWAKARTEVPLTMRGYLRQRLRWSLGGLQVLAKHRDMMMSKQKLSVGFWGLPYHYIIGYVIPPMELLGIAMLPVLPLFSQISWSTVTGLFFWLLLIKLYSLTVLIPARKYAQRITGIRIPFRHLFEYWFVYYYLLLITVLTGLITYMERGDCEW
ncbi:glycosyltransferase family 2 protein [Thermococcus sp.]|uniref:glycosyltransferase n=2 Tax=Thermococcus sp. TaxID=35749 RepID=UPI0026251717|nr:glycosyltransferase family 2 protein [Thermococcus sp.]